MKYYIEITLLPDADITLDFIWQKVYQQVHIALVDNKTGENESAIAVAFPLYRKQKFPLGNKLRLLAEKELQLSELNVSQWLNRLQDYVHIKAIKAVPQNAHHVCFTRKHVKGQANIDKKMQSKAEYWSKKSGQPIEECLLSLEKTKPKSNSKLPFIWLESQETKQRNVSGSSKFPLFITKVEVVESQVGSLNCYGLSPNHKSTAKLVSVPQF